MVYVEGHNTENLIRTGGGEEYITDAVKFAKDNNFDGIV